MNITVTATAVAEVQKFISEQGAADEHGDGEGTEPDQVHAEGEGASRLGTARACTGACA